MKPLIFALLIFASCAPTETKHPVSQPVYVESETFRKGRQQLESMGYTDIKQETYPLFCCSDDDSFVLSTGFSAKTRSGELVSGCICTGWLKGVTIRFS